MRLVESLPGALRIRIEMKPRLPFKLRRINRKPRYLSPSAISAFFFFISLDAISIGHFAGEPDRNLYENFGQLVWHERYAANRRGSLFPPLACTPLAKKQLQPPLVIPLLIPFWLGGETRFQSYCLESVRRVAFPLSNELTFHETFVSGFNFSFRFVIFDEIRRMIGLPRSEFAFDVIRYQETLSFLVLGHYCTSRVALMMTNFINYNRSKIN